MVLLAWFAAGPATPGFAHGSNKHGGLRSRDVFTVLRNKVISNVTKQTEWDCENEGIAQKAVRPDFVAENSCILKTVTTLCLPLCRPHYPQRLPCSII